MTHWMAHTTVDSIAHIVMHEKNEEVAKMRIQSIMNYLVIGWVKLAMIPIDNKAPKTKPKKTK